MRTANLKKRGRFRRSRLLVARSSRRFGPVSRASRTLGAPTRPPKPPNARSTHAQPLALLDTPSDCPSRRHSRLSANFTGTSTTLSTARGPRRAGTNVHFFTALNAALPRTRQPQEAATLTSTTRPPTPTRMERPTTPSTRCSRAAAGYDGRGAYPEDGGESACEAPVSIGGGGTGVRSIREGRLTMRRITLTSLALALGGVLALASLTLAQQAPPTWKQGQPRELADSPLAPIAQPPAPKAPGEIPIEKIKVPPGFKVSLWAHGINNARAMTWGDKGTLFVSSRVAGNVYAVVDKGAAREVKTIAKGLN